MEQPIKTTPGVNQRGEPFVEMRWGSQSGQFTPDEARVFALHILECAEAANSDAAIYRVITKRMELSPHAAGTMLDAMREARDAPRDAGAKKQTRIREEK